MVKVGGIEISEDDLSDQEKEAVADLPGVSGGIDPGDIPSAIADVPADAVNASTGTGKNLGWFGEVDRHLDYRSLTGEKDPNDDSEWAEPTAKNNGLDAAFASLGQQGKAAGEDAQNAAKWATPEWLDWLIENPWKTGAAGLVLYLWMSSGGPIRAASAAGG